MHMLRLYSPADLEACPLDRWGILDPGTERRDPEGKGQAREDGRCSLEGRADSSYERVGAGARPHPRPGRRVRCAL